MIPRILARNILAKSMRLTLAPRFGFCDGGFDKFKRKRTEKGQTPDQSKNTPKV
jgi:hypothetical protein